MTTTDHDAAFELFLARSLAPPERVPDQPFIRRVSQQILLEKLHRRSRGKMVERLGIEILSIIAIGAGLLAIGAGRPIADSAGNIPPAPLLGMVILFGLWVTIVSRRQRARA